MRGRTRKLRGSIAFAEGLSEADVFRNSGYQQSSKPFRGSRSQNSAEKPSQKQPRKAEAKRLQALLAEGLRKGFAEGVVSVVKLYRNENHRSYVPTLMPRCNPI